MPAPAATPAPYDPLAFDWRAAYAAYHEERRQHLAATQARALAAQAALMEQLRGGAPATPSPAR